MRLPRLVALVVLAPGPSRAYVRAATPSGAPWHRDRPVLTRQVHARQPGSTLTSDARARAATA